MNPGDGVLLMIGGAAAGGAFTAAAIPLAHRLGALARPNPIVARHVRSVAYLGGVAVGLAAAVAIGLHRLAVQPSAPAADHAVAVGVGVAAFLALGLVDDLRPLEPGMKLLLQAAAALASGALGLVAPITAVASIDLVLTAVIVVVVVNAVNLTDVSDGLVAGLSAIALVFYAVVAGANPVLALACAGACVGFLIFNFAPARIFLGDAGSLLLGFVLAGEVVVAFERRPRVASLLGALVAIGVPLFELVFVSAVRIRQGLPAWRGSPDHFALRLQAAGRSARTVSLIGWGMTAALCLAGWAIPRLPGAGQAALGVGLAGVAWVCTRALLRWEAPAVRADRAPEPVGAGVAGGEVGVPAGAARSPR